MHSISLITIIAIALTLRVSTSAPSPVSTSPDTGASQPSSLPPPSSDIQTTSAPSTTTRTPRTTTPSPTSTRTTSPPPIWLGSSNGDVEDSSPPSQATNDLSRPCTTTEIDDMLLKFVTVAKTTACEPYSTVSLRSVNITTSCTSPCRQVELWLNLAYAMPDCYYAYENQNKRTAVAKELDKCFLTTASSASTFVSVQIVSKDLLPPAPPSKIAAGTSPPAKASASVWKSGTWLASALLGVTVVIVW